MVTEQYAVNADTTCTALQTRTKIIGKNVWKVVRIIWIIIVMIVLSFWLIAGLVYLTGGEVLLG